MYEKLLKKKMSDWPQKSMSQKHAWHKEKNVTEKDISPKQSCHCNR